MRGLWGRTYADNGTILSSSRHWRIYSRYDATTFLLWFPRCMNLVVFQLSDFAWRQCAKLSAERRDWVKAPVDLSIRSATCLVIILIQSVHSQRVFVFFSLAQCAHIPFSTACACFILVISDCDNQILNLVKMWIAGFMFDALFFSSFLWPKGFLLDSKCWQMF